MDKKQVENIVKTIYGIAPETSDIEGYLKKFIDVEFNLPAPEYTDFICFQLQQIIKGSAHFIESQRWYAFGETIDGKTIDGKPYKGELVDKVVQLVTFLNLTPRSIEKLFMRVKLTIESLSENDLLLIEVIFILNALYICDKKEFDSYIDAEPFHSNLGTLGLKIDSVFPYWTKVLANINATYKIYQQQRRAVEPLSKEANVGRLVSFIHATSKLDINQYLKSYATKIEFIGSMD